jgi:hypothetical protein
MFKNEFRSLQFNEVRTLQHRLSAFAENVFASK